MTAKEYLQQYQNVNQEINAKLDQISRLRELATKTTTVLGDNKVQTSTENKTEKIIAKIVDLENEVNAGIDRLQEIKQRVENVINTVPDANQRAVLERRYINGKHWEEIAVELSYTYQWVCELHGRALQKISEQLIEVDT